MSADKEERLRVALLRLAADRKDADAWEALYAVTWRMVFSTLYRAFNGNGYAAEDAAQETFLRLSRYCRFIHVQDPAPFRKYLVTIARNVARDFQRGARPGREVLWDQTQLADVKDPGPMAQDAVDARDHFVHVLARLRPDDRKTIELDLQGYTLPEIATTVGVSYSAAALRLHRARKRLKKIIEDEDRGTPQS